MRGVAHFLQPAADRLYADLNIQILGNPASRRWIQNHEKGSRADVGMSPERDDAGTYTFSFDDWKWRPVVRCDRCGRHAKHNRCHQALGPGLVHPSAIPRGTFRAYP